MKFVYSAMGILCLLGSAAVAQRTCYSCDSSTDANCATLSVLPATADCLLDTDRCAATIVGQRTLRGCLDELEQACTDETCGICDGDLCNGAIYPADRLQCHTCSTCDYITNNANLKVCENYVATDSCYVVADQVPDPESATVDIVSYRGCASAQDDGKAYCDSHSDKCVACSTTGCNTNPTYTETALTCYKCNSVTSAACGGAQVGDDQPCDYNVFLGADERCYSYLSANGDVIRGCLNELFSNDNIRVECEANDAKCTACSGAACNSISYTAPTTLSCYKCSSSADPNCGRLQTGATDVCNYEILPGGVENCYSYVDGTSVLRGCLNELSPANSIRLQCEGNNPNCAICDSGDCNSVAYTGPSSLTCHKCNSGTDANCGDAQVGDSQVCNYEIFQGVVESCYTYFEGDYVIRGCLNELSEANSLRQECEAGSEKCVTCASGDCNALATLGPSALTCHKCYSATDDSCADAPVGVSQVCNYQIGLGEEEKCYMYVASNGDVLRGCLNELNPGNDIRNQCEWGDPRCVSCESGDCNSLPSSSPTTLTCYKCSSGSDPNCFDEQLGQSQACSYNLLVGETEKCYTYVSTSGDVLRGCLNELSPLNDIRMQCDAFDEKCQACNGADCNKYVAQEEDYGSCVLCDGTEDPNCALLQDSYTTAKCSEHAVGGCFRANVDGSIIRSCVSDLLPGEVSLCQRGQTCKICQGDLCNAKVDFTVCHSCDSTTNAACINYQTTSSRTCSDYHDSCAAYIDMESGATIRGCKNELTAYEGCEANSIHCVDCDVNYCNAAPIPWSRIKCHQCEGLACTTTSFETAQYCRNYQDNDQCYSVFATVNGENQIYRGCVSDAAATSPGKQLCDAQGDNCRKCSNSECNNEVATWTSSLRCYKCDSATGDSCHFDQSQSLSSRCEYDLEIGADDHCFSYFDGERALRGCIHDAPADIQAKCAAGSDECRLCETVDCNAEEIETNGQCYYCDGTVDANCETLIGHNPVYCPVGDRTGCFRSQIDGKVARGCLTHLVAGELSICTQQGTRCKTCTGDNCNAKLDYQRCFTCNSLTNANCLQSQDTTTGAVETTCSGYLDQCVTYIDNGVTYRGCRGQSQVPTTCPSTTCSFCSGGNCNALVFPNNRLQCHQCSGSSEECMQDLSNYAAQRSVCRNYIAGDSCYAYLSSDRTSITRGCVSDADESAELCATSGDQCHRCPLTACNHVPAFTRPTLSCVSCEAADENCGWGYATSEAETCTANVWLGESESCYRYQSGASAERGCTLDNADKCPANGVACETCTASGCNQNSYYKHKCYQCDSTISGQESCAKEVEDLASTECPGETQKLTDVGCYLLKADGGQVTRGCIASLSSEWQLICRDDSDECEYCNSDDCNNQNAGAAALKAVSLIALIAVALAKMGLN